ncbi:hypothetical protein JAAARDRAFT_39933 [Jaapia argillacea MUCL 33604]|uniref:G domain-containing protein n=1 Tax=Jaapia argillacea MUCL 33604 TaxID=933084 RepID=A0A067PCM2_9AGAM|nr:hypothetical protein JAAARDRAFT_39933 [Jaapia argillacea MUCL 33604]
MSAIPEVSRVVNADDNGPSVPPSGTNNIMALRASCPQFRILVIGKANAGKTTILHKVCNATPETKPIVYDQNGKKLRGGFFQKTSALFQKPTLQRGEHNIEHQITFPGSQFIFHDSRGFEAGAVGEMEIVREFIRKRSDHEQLKDKVHAIWYCVPMDDSRPLSDPELGFFKEGTWGVPVIAIFTKFDAQINITFGKLLEDGKTDQEAFQGASQYANKIFQEQYLSRLKAVPYQPKEWICLQDMDKPENNCSELIERTAAAIDDDGLRRLFISVQAKDLKLNIKQAIG